MARNKAIAAGVNPEEENSTRPPKVIIASKHDRQVDRRSYKEKFTLFESVRFNKNCHSCDKFSFCFLSVLGFEVKNGEFL